MPSSYPNPKINSIFMDGDIQKLTPYYAFMRHLCVTYIPMFCRTHFYGRHHEPANGGVLYICNHQSFLDPMLMGMGLRRPMNFMARSSLFNVPFMGKLISSLNTFPVNRGTADTAAIKEAMRRLKAKSQVVIFAEGTRTIDGHIGKFLPGVALLAKRAADWIVPTIIDGAYEAWPRDKKLPSIGNIVVQYAPPIPSSEFREMEPHEMLENVRQKIIEMQADIRKRLGRSELKY